MPHIKRTNCYGVGKSTNISTMLKIAPTIKYIPSFLFPNIKILM